MQELLSSDELLIAPAHWPFEVANGIIKARRRDRITREQAVVAFEIISDLQVDIHMSATGHVLWTLAPLAEANMLSVYDAAYLELAIRQDCMLATMDGALRGAAVRAGVSLLAA